VSESDSCGSSSRRLVRNVKVTLGKPVTTQCGKICAGRCNDTALGCGGSVRCSECHLVVVVLKRVNVSVGCIGRRAGCHRGES